MTWLIDQLAKEWAVIKQDPLSFGLIVGRLSSIDRRISLEIAYQELLNLKDTLPTGHTVGHRTILAYHDILASAEKRMGRSLARFAITDALRAIRVSRESPIEYFCAKKIFLREFEQALEYISKHASN